jgi:Tfp pilus assembly protein PilV
MTIFAIGMMGVLALLGNTISASFISRHEIVIANIQREELEFVKNIRNTNIRSFVDWDRARIEDGLTGQEYFTGGVFTVENDFTNSGVAFD